MLSNDAIYQEIEVMEKTRAAKGTDDVSKALIKGNVLIIKLLHNLRSNQVLIMKHEGIELQKGQRVGDDIETSTKK